MSGSMLTSSGTRHRVGWKGAPGQFAAYCGSGWMYAAEQSQIKHRSDCKRCLPNAPPDFSSDTLTDLQTAQQQRDQARDIAVRLEQENAELRQRVETEWFNGNMAAGTRDRLLAPVGAE